MSVSSSTGLISGLPTGEIITQLLAIEARPALQLKARVTTIDQQKSAYTQLGSLLNSIKTASARFDELNYFRVSKAQSSDSSVISATAADNTPTGSYRFQVASLVTNHQVVSTGMVDSDETPVGLGTITLESRRARVNPATALEALNEQRGVQRGSIRIRDRAGNTADVDLRTALTVEDIVTAINSRVDVSVRASVRGDSLVLTDASGGTGSLTVSDVGATHTASDLGVASSVQGNEIVGSPLLRLTEGTAVDSLNDQVGIRRVSNTAVDGDFIVHMDGDRHVAVNLSGKLQWGTQLDELNSGQGVRLGVIKITNRAGQTATVDLNDRGDGTAPKNIQEVVNRIQAAKDDATGAGLNIAVGMVNSSLFITDTSLPEKETAKAKLTIEDVSGFAAQDLGIAKSTDELSFRGSAVYRVRTLGDVLRAIEYAPLVTRDADGKYTNAKDDAGRFLYNAGDVSAAIAPDGKRLSLAIGTEGYSIELRNGSKAALDLGIVDPATFDAATQTGSAGSERIIAGLNTVLLKSLNGGKGIGQGVIRIEAGDGQSGQPGTGTTTLVDLSNVDTLQDVLDAINATSSTSKVRAEISSSGLGIVMRDLSGGTGKLSVSDVSGTAATDLKIAGAARTVVGNGNLQRQYVNEGTLLSSLNGGTGISFGRFRITNSQNQVVDITLRSDTQSTIGDVLQTINGMTGISKVTARINDTGDGIVLEDASGGTQRMTVTEVSGGKAATSLNLAGQAATDSTTIDGSYEVHIDVGSDDTLQDVADKINNSGRSATASLINDGSPLNPYRLSILSKVTGTPGEMLIDGGTTGMGFNTLVEARDAVVFFGGQESPDSIRIVSSTNTVTGFIQGLTLNLTGTSSDPVNVSVSRDVDKMVADVSTFVSVFNGAIGQISTLTKYDADTNTRGLLMGDQTVNTIQSRLYSMVTGTVADADPNYRRLSDVGLTIGDGAQLKFDEEKFRAAYAADQAAVEKLFTYTTTQTVNGKETVQKYGLGYRIQDLLTEMTAPSTGLIARQSQQLDDRKTFFNDRIADMEKLLEGKRKYLEAQFQAMETNLAKLQGQQSALSGLTSIAASSTNLSNVSAGGS